jgi:hypothetical protein
MIAVLTSQVMMVSLLPLSSKKATKILKVTNQNILHYYLLYNIT